MRYAIYCIFFFQAEDGIRDLVRSRGLGDVYKRQTKITGISTEEFHTCTAPSGSTVVLGRFLSAGGGAVSYTHLTLPTSDLV